MREILLLNSLPVPMFTVQDSESDKTEERQENTVANTMTEQDFTEALIQAARTVTLS